jgi:hypothetical protein
MVTPIAAGTPNKNQRTGPKKVGLFNTSGERPLKVYRSIRQAYEDYKVLALEAMASSGAWSFMGAY